MNKGSATGSAARVLPSAFLLLLDVGYIVTAYVTLAPASRQVPLLVAWVTLLMLVWDIVRELTRASPATGAATRSAGEKDGPGMAQEAKVLLSVTGLIAGIYLLGFYVAIPIYLVSAIRYLGGQSMRAALILTLVTCLAIYLTFDLILGYQIFPGILFF